MMKRNQAGAVDHSKDKKDEVGGGHDQIVNDDVIHKTMSISMDEDVISLSTSTNSSTPVPSPDTPFYVGGSGSNAAPTTKGPQPQQQSQQETDAPRRSTTTSTSSDNTSSSTSSLLPSSMTINNNNNDSSSNHDSTSSGACYGMDLDSDDSHDDDDGGQENDRQQQPEPATASTVAHLPPDFHQSPEPIGVGGVSVVTDPPSLTRITSTTIPSSSSAAQQQQSSTGSDNDHHQEQDHHQYHMLGQIQEDQVSTNNNTPIEDNTDNTNNNIMDGSGRLSPPPTTTTTTTPLSPTSPHRRSPIGSPLRRTSGFSSSLLSSFSSPISSPYHNHRQQHHSQQQNTYFIPQYTCTRLAYAISTRVFTKEEFAVATWLGFWALLNVTCANYVLTPMRDAVALQVGVQHIPKLTLASSLLAFLSSVPIGWLFEAPDPSRRKVWKKMGLTRGETQGTSLALFYRFFALSVLSYAVGFRLVDIIQNNTSSLRQLLDWFVPTSTGWWMNNNTDDNNDNEIDIDAFDNSSTTTTTMLGSIFQLVPYCFSQLGTFMSITFFLVIHLMKLHSISLVWGVTTEAMEYEDVARKQQEGRNNSSGSGSTGSLSSLAQQQQQQNCTTTTPSTTTKKRTRLQRLALVGFGGTLGGVWGSVIASSMAKYLGMSGLLIVSAFLLEISAELSIELGRVMQKHWQEQQIFQSTQDLTSLDPSMKRSASMGSMKRVASGNSLYAAHQQSMKRVASGNSLGGPLSTSKSLVDLGSHQAHSQPAATDDTATTMSKSSTSQQQSSSSFSSVDQPVDDNTFSQRLLRGITTILKSRLLMAIFTYNALFASTSVLLSFQRAELVANRNQEGTTVSADTAFLANINMASSIAVFAMQASGIGAIVAQKCGPRGSLALMPLIRLVGIMSLCWWHRSSNGQPPNLILFLMLDECTRVINLAVAKPVRESLWRGLSNEARYEAKPIVDTLANRWGAGSASFCVSVVSRVLLFFGQNGTKNHHHHDGPNNDPIVLGLPPVLFLGFIVAAWWLGVSLDLGHIRRRIDLELKKRQ